MTEIISLFLVLALIMAAVIKIWSANRRAGRLAAEAEQRAKERREMEKDLLERLGKLKERGDLSAAKSAIGKDPERAARVVSRMMKEKPGK